MISITIIQKLLFSGNRKIINSNYNRRETTTVLAYNWEAS